MALQTIRRAAVTLALMALPVTALAQGAQALAGEWRNPSATDGIVEARVYSQNGRQPAR